MPEQPSPAPDSDDPPETLFAAWLDAGGEEGECGFAELCERHPALVDELQRLHRTWRELGSVRMRMRGSGSIAARLSRRFGKEVAPNVSLDDEGDAVEEDSKAVIERLVGREHGVARYRILESIARGGMGEVLRVWDGDLRRKLAMKVMLGKLDAEQPSEGDSEPVAPSTLKRFLEESQITGQLDHPGIVPVHELGLDARGRLYFTMKLVKGRDLGEIFDLVRDGREGWSTVRALGLLLRVCEAMSYAHAKGVIHRDLKPPNVMVGRFGEVYVMDWGLAKVLGEAEERDIRIRTPGEEALTRILKLSDVDDGPDSPLVTMDGDVVGTPSYMPPEQAAGRLEDMGPHSDVYAMGSMIYHLLVGHMPFVPPGARVRSLGILLRVQEGPPRPVHELAPEAPAELVAICEKAMAREPAERYADMSRLAGDLSAYLEGRVVQAYETGALAEGRKWIRRNRSLAASLAAALLLALGGSVAVGVVQAKGKERAEHEAQLAREAQDRAEQSERRALSLSDAEVLDDLMAEADALWPVLPERLDELESFARRGADVLEHLESHRERLDGMRSRALPMTPAERERNREAFPGRMELARARADFDALEQQLETLDFSKLEAAETELAELDERIVELSAQAEERRLWTFETKSLAWRHRKHSELVAALDGLVDERDGLLGLGRANRFGWGIGRRIEFARGLEEASISSPAARAAWSEASETVRADPRFEGLGLTPQLGLLPIGVDPDSGLCEFAHLASGDVAPRDAQGRIVPSEAMGLVLVLVPGGDVRYGAQATSVGAPHHDPQAVNNEAPVSRARLDPYFISKFEMTQAQWLRIDGSEPSTYAHERNWKQDWFPDQKASDLVLPVQKLTWEDCRRVLTRLDLEFPTEVQWEAAARAGGATPYPLGSTASSLQGFANILDVYASKVAFELEEGHSEIVDDRAGALSPIGWYQPNAYGLHDVIGNVQEYCRDAYSLYGRVEARDGDGLRERPAHEVYGRVVRGGSYKTSERSSRVSGRGPQDQLVEDATYGLRPARALRQP